MLQFRKLVCDMEKEMATHTRVLAWRISGTEEPHPPDMPWAGLLCSKRVCFVKLEGAEFSQSRYSCAAQTGDLIAGAVSLYTCLPPPS